MSSQDELLALIQESSRRQKRWKPFPEPSPQRMALESEADILLYGGAAGGGKTDLLLGCARYEHTDSIIFRRVFPSLQAIIDRSKVIYTQAEDGTLDNYNEGKSRWHFEDGSFVRFGSIQHEKNVTDHQGQPHDLYGFDEITEFSEQMFRFVIGWNRSAKPGQRCRVICTGNPPTTPEGEWVLDFWAPWLSDTHPNPAKPGELRWFTTIAGKDVECPNGDPIEVDGEWVKPLSRTFIPARVQDNPILMGTNYLSNLQALPEPLRSKMLYGDFRAGREDASWQVIPSAWVDAAMERWKRTPKPNRPMTALGIDVARGGEDKTCLAPRWHNWYDKVHKVPGKETPNGQTVAALAVLHVKNSAEMVVDVIGVGASAYDFLAETERFRVTAFNAAAGSSARDRSHQLKFANKRAAAYWGFREALDPANREEICLPPDPELKADLCAPTWKFTREGILVEPKDQVTKRIHRSPDSGDSVVLASTADVDESDMAGLHEWAVKSYPTQALTEHDPMEEYNR